MAETNLAVKRYNFDDQIFDEFNSLHYAKDLWPLVYILSDDKSKEAYVGETTDAYARMKSHLKNNQKQKLTVVHLVTSEKFNKSATLDIESNLIKYIAGDGQYKLLNGNLGIANHEYYQKKEVYREIFKTVWNKLRGDGITKHSLEHIDNSDLFKYSPYKTLTSEQKLGLLLIINNLLSDRLNNVIIEGGAGTGKTILAIFLFKLLNSDNADFNFKEFGSEENEFIAKIKELKAKYPKPNMALVIPMSSFRSTLKKVFRNIKGLKASMVIGPAEVAKNTYDILLVDEAHRLRRRVNLGAYFGAFDKACIALELDKHTASELDFVVKQPEKTVLFYDEGQSIKPSDVKKEDFDKLKKAKGTNIEYLKSQFRVRGGNGYVTFIEGLLHCKMSFEKQLFKSKEYEFLLFDSLENMVAEIKLREKEHELARLVAGYSWPWISNKDASKFDINIGNVSLTWNSV
ncbi:MAG: DNA/RNA helicase domain-containing protein, partial [Crocinitomicaceae bacterium]